MRNLKERFIWIFPKFTEIVRNFAKFTEIVRNCPKLSEISRNLPKFREIYRNFAKFTEISRNLPKFRETLLTETDRNFTEISRNFPKLTEISRNEFCVSVETLVLTETNPVRKILLFDDFCHSFCYFHNKNNLIKRWNSWKVFGSLIITNISLWGKTWTKNKQNHFLYQGYCTYLFSSWYIQLFIWHLLMF